MKRRNSISTLCLAAALTAAAAFAAEDHVIAAGIFSSLAPGGALPAEWKPMKAANIRNATRYTLVGDGGVTVLRADAQAAASGLSRPLHVDPAEAPWLRWRWKIASLIDKADLRRKDSDDFPARLYVMFDYPLEKLPFVERSKIRLARALFDPDLPVATLCYVWDGKAPAGTIAPSAYTSRVKIIVAESGAARIGRWVEFERNVAQDFRAAFGEDAPPVSAIAVATDSDNTGAFATAFYGDISFNKQRLEKPAAEAPAKP